MKVHYECRWPYGFKQPWIKNIWGNRTSLVVQWLRLCTSNAGGTGSISGQGSSNIPSSVAKKKKKNSGEEISESSKKQILCLSPAGNHVHSIYTVLGIISHVGWFKEHGRMNLGYMQIQCHFIHGTWVSINFGIHRGSWNQTSTDIEG